MKNFYSMTREHLGQWLQNQQLHPGHRDLMFRTAYKSMSQTPWLKEGLPKFVQQNTAMEMSCDIPVIHTQQVSEYDQTVKFLFKLKDGQLVESVLMPETSRLTICISSQVGCRQACRFCHTGKMGLQRNLEAGEMIAQIMAANLWISEHPEWTEKAKLPKDQRVSNVVFMGMGEPLDNLTEVSTALNIMLDPHGLALAPKKITVSTAGHLDGLKELVAKNFGVGLAFSLHETDLKRRTWLMPINRRYPLDQVLEFFKTYTQDRKKHVLIQYTVIDQVNDSEEHALRLVSTLEGIRVKINLIPLNPVEANQFEPPDPARLQGFQSILIQNGIRSMIRFSKGQDIDAACGQLVVKKNKSLSANL